jgi:hypothetical protein
MSQGNDPNLKKTTHTGAEKASPKATKEASIDEQKEAPREDHKEVTSKTKKEPFVIDWKSVGIGILLGIVVTLILAGIGAKLTKVNIGILEFTLPQSTGIPVAQSTSTMPSVSPTSIPSPGAVLVSASFMEGDWDPRIIDLRTAATSGIPIDSGNSLNLFDLWVYVPEATRGSEVQAEVYANGELIGVTPIQKAIPEIMRLEDIRIKSFQHPSINNAWMIQDDWKELDIVTLTYLDGKATSSATTSIRVGSQGSSWMIASPYASFALILYKINDAKPVILDMRSAMDTGIQASPGDTLTIQQVWYQARMGALGHQIQFEAYLSAGGYDQETLLTSPQIYQDEGVHEITGFIPLKWVVPEDKRSLVISITRDDRTLLDRLVIPFNTEANSGLVNLSDAVVWPFGSVTYEDFESPGNPGSWGLSSWSPSGKNTILQSSAQAFSGSYSLAITTRSDGNEFFIERNRLIFADYLVGQVYWPAQDGITVSWAQACERMTGQCVSIPTQYNQWNTFIMDFSEWPYGKKYLNQVGVPGIYIQGNIQGASDQNPYTFYVDGIQLYPAHTAP